MRWPGRRLGNAMGRPRLVVLLAFGLMTLGFGLRLFHLGTQEIWLDESSSFMLATTDDFLERARYNTNPPLYFALLRAWMNQAGSAAEALRIPSAIFGALFVGAVFWTGRYLFDDRAALLAALVAATSPIHIYYSQEARVYALLTLCMMLAWGCLVRALSDETSSWWWGAFGLVAGLALWAHNSASLALLAAGGLVWAEARKGGREWRRYGACLAAAAVAYAPWIATRLATADRSTTDLDWIASVWRGTPPAAALWRTFESFTVGDEQGLLAIPLKQLDRILLPPWLKVLALIVVAALLASSMRRICLEGLSRQAARRRLAVWLLLLAPLVGMWLYSLAIDPVYVAGRYDMVAFGAFPLLVGEALARLSRSRGVARWSAAGVALVLSATVGIKLYRYYTAPPVTPHAQTAEVLLARVERGDIVVFTGLRGLPVLYQLDRRGFHWRDGVCVDAGARRNFYCRMYPLATEKHPGAFDPGPREAVERRARDDAREILAPNERGATVFVVFDVFSASAQQFRVKTFDAHFVAALGELGFRAVEVLPKVGVVAYRHNPASIR